MEARKDLNVPRGTLRYRVSITTDGVMFGNITPSAPRSVFTFTSSDYLTVMMFIGRLITISREPALLFHS